METAVNGLQLPLQAFKRAKEAADAELAQGKTPPKQASEEEVHRVLAAKTDYECLQVVFQPLLQLYSILCVDSAVFASFDADNQSSI